MNKLFVGLIFIALSFSSLNANAIIGGKPNTNPRFKIAHKVYFLSSATSKIKADNFCTATILSNYTILTAAHCVYNKRGKSPTFLVLDGKKMKIQRVLTRASYRKKSSQYQSSLVTEDALTKRYFELAKKVGYEVAGKSKLNRSRNRQSDHSRRLHIKMASDDIAIIQTNFRIAANLKRTRLSFDYHPHGTRVIAAGYGYTKLSATSGRYSVKPKTQINRMSVLANTINNCYELFSKSLRDGITAPGDSGSPLIHKRTGVQIAVLRGIVPYRGMIGSLYTPLGKHRDFIERNTKY